MRFGVRHASLMAIATLAAACSTARAPAPPRPLTLASWNLEHLAEKNGSGCRPRTERDYLALASFAAGLDADVVAFQEVESIAAAERVFPSKTYAIVMEERPGAGEGPPCYGAPDQRLNRQAVGFAIRRTLAFDRAPDVIDLQLGDPNLRSGVDITLRPAGQPPLRLLAVHLKSGCVAGATNASCETVARQADILAEWAAKRGAAGERFALLGDFNRRLAIPGDQVWAKLDDPHGPADLSIASGQAAPQCDPRYTTFIDHILLDAAIALPGLRFREWTYSRDRLSDHCPIGVTLER